MKSITVMLVDDHQVLRQGLRLLLEREPDIRIVAEAGNGLDALRLVAEKLPNVVILDLMLPGLHGLAVTDQISKQFPDTCVVILSMHDDIAYVWEALHKGAVGYVLKDSSTEDLVTAVRAAAAGSGYLSPPLSAASVRAYARRTKDGKLDLYQTLTDRERQVVQLSAEGHSNKEIATRLGISVRTAETHRANLTRKLNLTSQADLVRFAAQRGLLRLGDGVPPP